MSKKYFRVLILSICFIGMDGLRSSPGMAVYKCDKLLDWCLKHWWHGTPGPHCYVYNKYAGSLNGEMKCDEFAKDSFRARSACHIGAKRTADEKKCTTN